jgi:hypothetical protein
MGGGRHLFTLKFCYLMDSHIVVLSASHQQSGLEAGETPTSSTASTATPTDCTALFDDLVENDPVIADVKYTFSNQSSSSGSGSGRVIGWVQCLAGLHFQHLTILMQRTDQPQYFLHQYQAEGHPNLSHHPKGIICVVVCLSPLHLL